MNNRNNKPYNVTIIYDDPKKETGVPADVSPVAIREGREPLAPWQIALLFGAALFLLWVGGAFPWFLEGEKRAIQKEQESVASLKNPFDRILLEASAAFVFDIQKQKALYAKNEEKQLPLASLTKLVAALIAEETLPESGILTVDKDAIAEEGDNGLLVGERWRKKDLIGLTLLASSNDGTHALASAVEAFQKANAARATSTPNHSSDTEDTGQATHDASFVSAMNARAKALGMKQTYFLNANGLDMHEKESGAYGSARDIAALLAYILREHPDIFEATQYEKKTFISEDGVAHELKNTNERIFAVPGLVASKTGFTDIAGGNLAVLFEAGPMYPVAVVVLGSSVEGRFSDIEKLVAATLGYLHQ